jgi:hypothetical protein
VEEARLPAHLEVSSLIRRTHAEGGFAAVLHKGEAQAGTIMIIMRNNGANARVYERMPQADGTRKWHCSKKEDPENKEEFSAYIDRRSGQDRDMWIIELDIAQAERLIGLTTPLS